MRELIQIHQNEAGSMSIFRDQYGICELCGELDFRQNGACLTCVEYWGL